MMASANHLARSVTGTVAAILALMTLPALAESQTTPQKKLTPEGVVLAVRSEVRGSRFNPPPDDPADVEADFNAPVELEAYIGTKVIPEYIPFDGVHGVDDAFVSAQIKASADGGVGVSGLHETRTSNDRADGFMRSEVEFKLAIRNTGDAGGPVDLTIKIPKIELTVIAEENADDQSAFQALAAGALFAQHYAAPAPGTTSPTNPPRGELLRSFTLFDYRLEFINTEELIIDISPDLLLDAGPALTDVCGAIGFATCLSARYDPFEITQHVLDELQPRESVEFQYVMVARMSDFGPQILDGQSGGRAFYGDPLAIGGGGSGGLLVQDLGSAPVPLPGTLALLLPGLAVLGRLARRPRYVSAASPDSRPARHAKDRS